MKNIKRILSVVLVPIMLLSTFVYTGVFASANNELEQQILEQAYAEGSATEELSLSSDIFDRYKYMADILADNYKGIAFDEKPVYRKQLEAYMDETMSPSQLLLESIQENSSFVATVVAWEAATFKPSNITDGALNEVGYYEAVLFALLDSLLKADSFLEVIKSDEAKLTLKITETVTDVLKNEYEIDYKQVCNMPWEDLLPGLKLTMMETVSDELVKWESRNATVKDFSKIIDNTATVLEYVNRMSCLGELIRCQEDIKAVLQEMYENCPDNNIALKSALAEVKVACANEFGCFLAGVIDGTITVGNEFIGDAMNLMWVEVIGALGSGAGAVLLAVQAVTTGFMNVLFSPDKIVEQYYKLKVLCDVEDLLYDTIWSLESSYVSDRTTENAKAFLKSIDMMFEIKKLGCDFAIKFSELVFHGGIIGSISKLFGENATHAGFVKSTENIKDDFAFEQKWILDIDNYIFYIEVDYPDEYASMCESNVVILPEVNPEKLYFGTTREGNNYYLYYTVDDSGKITITEYEGIYGGTIEIPATIDGHEVKFIGDEAFYECKGITEIIFTGFMQSVGERAFYGCSGLKSITLPRTFTGVGSYAFEGCTSLETVYYYNSQEMWDSMLVFEGNECLLDAELILIGGITASGLEYETDDVNGTALIIGCSDNVEDIVIPQTIDGYLVTGIGDKAFADCVFLSTITIPNSVISIGDNAFYLYSDGDSLKSNVTIKCYENSYAHAYAVKNGFKYELFEIITGQCGDNITWTLNTLTGVLDIIGTGDIYNYDYGDYAPWWTYKEYIKTVNIGNGIKNIGDCAFYECDSLTSVTFPDSVTSIGFEAFYSCTSLTGMTIPNSVINIGAYSFEKCTSLKSVTIPNSVLSIDNGTFYNCTGLTNVTIGNAVANIAYRAFAYCESLVNVTIPDSVTSIGESAFENCSSLTKVTIPDSVTSIGVNAFTKTKCMEVENGISYIGKHLIKANRYVVTGDVTIRKNTVLIADAAFELCTGITGVTIPDSVKYIGDNAFMGNYNMMHLTIGNSVLYIGISAFSGCESLGRVEIPDSVTSIGASAFSYCGYLKSVILGDSIVTIGDGAFSLCQSLVNINIGNSVTSIGKSAFEGCSVLESITIPDSVTQINVKTFYGCSSLENIVLPDSINTIERDAFYGCNNLTIRCYMYSYVDRYASNNSIPVEHMNTIQTLIVDTLPKKTTYPIGGTLDLDGIVLIAVTDRGARGTVTSGYTVGGYDFSTDGEKVITVSYMGVSTAFTVKVESPYPESAHPYPNYSYQTWTYTYPTKCASLLITFSEETYVEENQDKIYIYDTDGICIGKYTGADLAGVTIEVPGNGFDIKLISDYIVTGYGFYITSVIPKYETTNKIYGTCGSYLNWILDEDGILTISGRGAMEDYSKYSLSPWYDYRMSIDKVVIGDSVTSIGDHSFDACTSLTSVTIGNSVTSIGDHSFDACTSLTSVIIPDAVASIGSYAFDSCSSLVSVTIPDAVTSIGDYAFYYCTSLTRVNIPNALTNIDKCTFCYCIALISVTIPDSVTSIGDSAFADCHSLTSVAIPDAVTVIGNSVFRSCYSLTSVTVPASVTSMGDSVFSYCTSLISVTVDDNNQYYTSIDGVIYDKDITTLIQYPAGDSRTSFIIPDSVTSIGDRAFYGSSFLTSVIIPNSVTNIGNSAFCSCSSLTSVIIPDSVTSIGTYAFSRCTSLTSVIIPDSITSISNYAFAGDDSNPMNLTSVIIPDSVTSIGNYAFYYCRYLKNVTIPESVTSIGNYAFFCCKYLECVNIPNSVTRIGYTAFGSCSFLKGVYITDIAAWCSINFGSSDSNPLNYAKKLYLNEELVTDLVIPDSVTSIGDYAFRSCTDLTCVTIPESVTSIGEDAFRGCNNLIIRSSANSYASKYANLNSIPVEYTNSIVSLSVECLPEKTVYPLNGVLKTDGLVLKAVCDDGTEVSVSSGYTVGEYDFSTGGEKEITVSYGESSTTFKVTVDPSIVVYPESQHPYPGNSNETWTYTHPTSCSSIKVTFSSDTYTESGWDYIYIYDIYGNEIGSYTGIALSGITIELPGNSFSIKLTSDSSVNKYGFSIDNIEGIVVCNHTFTNYISNNDATCAVDGTKTAYCDNGCGETDTIIDEGSVTGAHVYGDWNVITEATYLLSGEKIRFCKYCDSIETQVIEKSIPKISVNNYVVTISGADYINHMRFASGEHTTASSIKNDPSRVDLSASVITKNTIDGKLVYEMPDGGYYTFWVRMTDGTEYFLTADMSEFTPTVDTYGVKITVDGLYDVKDFFIAKGGFNSYNEIKNNGYIVRVTENKIAGKHSYTYTVSDPGMHTVLVRYNDGREYFFHEDLTVDEPVFTTNGLQVTVSNIPDVKVIRTAYGEYYTPGDTKRAEGARNFSNKSVIKDAETYMLQYREEGRVTIVVEYNNGYVKVFHYDVTKKQPTVIHNCNTVTFGNLDGMLMIRYAKGKYTTSAEIKRASGSKVIKSEAISDGKITISDLVMGEIYTFCVQYDDDSYGYTTIMPKHSWSDWQTISEPTASTEGLKRRECQICDQVELEILPIVVKDYTMRLFIEDEYVEMGAKIDGTDDTEIFISINFGDNYNNVYGAFPAASLEGYDFQGWYIEAYDFLITEDEWKNNTYVVPGDCDLYAIFEKVYEEPEIPDLPLYNENGVDGYLAVGTFNYDLITDYQYTIFEFAPEETGEYIITVNDSLVGIVSYNGMWVTVEPSVETVVDDFVAWNCTRVGQSIWVAVKGGAVAGGITVSEVNEYTLKFVADTDSVITNAVPLEIEIDIGDKYSDIIAELPIAEKEGYVFKGWYNRERRIALTHGFDVEKVFDIYLNNGETIYNIDKSIELFPIWDTEGEKDYTLTFVNYDIEGFEPINYKFNEGDDLLSVFAGEFPDPGMYVLDYGIGILYEFKGWMVDDSDVGIFLLTESDMWDGCDLTFGGDLELYAYYDLE